MHCTLFNHFSMPLKKKQLGSFLCCDRSLVWLLYCTEAGIIKSQIALQYSLYSYTFICLIAKLETSKYGQTNTNSAKEFSDFQM